MPASGIDFYIQDARNNFDAVRPAPIPIDANNVTMGQSQNIHISTNCYYGYHNSKRLENSRQTEIFNDCEMAEVTDTNKMPNYSTAKKRSADTSEFPQNKKLRQEVQRENIEPETNETMNVERKEDLLELLYWNTHGGYMFHLIYSVCDDL